MKKDKKKILILFTSGSLGGTEISLTRMALYKSNLFEYQLATMGSYGDWSDFCNKNKLHPKVFGNSEAKLKFLGFNLKSIKNLYKDINLVSYEVIYVFGFRLSILVRLLRIFTSKFKIVIGVRWNPNSKAKLDKIFRISESFLFKTVNNYICNSMAAYDTMLKIKPDLKKRVSIIYNGVSISNENFQSIDSEDNNIIFPANILKSKGHIQFLDIIYEVIKVFPNVKFLMAGKDQLKGELNNEIKNRGLEKYIDVLGFQKNLYHLMRNSKFMVLPSYSEGCPTSILEAFANKIPVIAYCVDGIPELIKEGYDGYLIDPFNKKKFISKILFLLKNSEYTSKMGKRGRLKVEKFFTISKCAMNHEDLFEKIIMNQ
jgi:glycosyltransferase involved in cell wall biosynthesis